MKENSIEMSNIDENRIIKIKRGKSIIKIGNWELGGDDIEIEVSTKFNWLQKKAMEIFIEH